MCSLLHMSLIQNSLTGHFNKQKGLGIKTAIDSHIAGENIASRSMSAEKVNSFHLENS